MLVPAVTTRTAMAHKLLAKLEAQATPEVELICLLDNKKRSTGKKRDNLLRLAQGDYVAFVDDDDDVTDDYVSSIIQATADNPDVVVFDHLCWLNGQGPFVVHPGLAYPNEEAHKLDGRWVDVTRQPLHTSAWRRSLALQSHFPDIMYGEDWGWAESLVRVARTESRINRPLYYYRYDRSLTECE